MVEKTFDSDFLNHLSIHSGHQQNINYHGKFRTSSMDLERFPQRLQSTHRLTMETRMNMVHDHYQALHSFTSNFSPKMHFFLVLILNSPVVDIVFPYWRRKSAVVSLLPSSISHPSFLLLLSTRKISIRKWTNFFCTICWSLFNGSATSSLNIHAISRLNSSYSSNAIDNQKKTFFSSSKICTMSC